MGVRKALGAGRGQLATQFLAESVLLVAASAAVGVLLASALLPAFNDAFGTDLLGGDLDGPFWLAGGLTVITVGLLAGAYPALVISGFHPGRVLRGARAASGRQTGATVRRVLVTVQFATAIGLMAVTAVVLRQIAFSVEADPGFVPKGLVYLPLSSERLGRVDPERAVPWEAALNAARAVPGVQAAVPAGTAPGQGSVEFSSPLNPERPDDISLVRVVVAGPGYSAALGVPLVAGTDRSRIASGAVINETAAEAMGWTPEEAIGKTVRVGYDFTVAGVVKDFHFASTREKIKPLVIAAASEATPFLQRYGGVLARLDPATKDAALSSLERAWGDLVTDMPFEPVIVEEVMSELYEAERRLSRILGAFASIAAVVACLGLIGLAAYTAERRAKEIGVRRVLGASTSEVVVLLTREYAALVALGAAVAIPPAAYALSRWLEGFAYRISLGPGVFAAVVLLALLLALAVVAAQALHAAWRDPARVLRLD